MHVLGVHKHSADIPVHDHIGCNSSTSAQLQSLSAVAAIAISNSDKGETWYVCQHELCTCKAGPKSPQSFERINKQSQVFANTHMTCLNKAAKSIAR